MKKHMQIIYAVFAGIAVLLLLFSSVNFDLNITKRKITSAYHKTEGYEYAKTTDYTAPVGIREEYVISPEEIGEKQRELMFYTIHQNVEVYAGDERIYSMRPNHKNAFGRTPGCFWNDVQLSPDDEGKNIRILIYPVYKSSVGIVPDFYFGDKYEIVRHFIKRDVPALLLGCVGVVAGVFFIAYIVYNYKNSELDKSLIMLGCFSIVVSLWKVTDLASINLWFPKNAALYLVPLVMLQLACIPFVLFMKELSSRREHLGWYVPCYASIGAMTLSLGLQLIKVKDLRQTLWMTHFVLLLTVVVTIAMVAYEVKTLGWNAKLKRNVKFIVICFLGFLFDLVVYYVGRGKYTSAWGMLGFIAYILMSGAFFMQDARQLMTIGMKAKNFERMAYHDQLTGLFNRTAYTSYVNSEDFSPEHCIVAVFDLNDLKKCNDVLGHEKGDVYIKECADAIRTAFDKVGRCYRMGGDEFCVLMQNVSLEQCKRRMAGLKEMVKKANERHPEINMGIACGYEHYDKRIDYDISDTTRRADRMMYEEKFSMKEKKA